MHLVLGSERVDLRHRVVVIAQAHGTADAADVAWLDAGEDLADGLRPAGADAATPDEVHRLADAGAVLVGLRTPEPALVAAALARDLTVLASSTELVGQVPSERLLVTSAVPVPDAIACLDLLEAGPAAWGRATVALAAGVRVVRTPEPRSIRRVAAVVGHLVTAGSAP